MNYISYILWGIFFITPAEYIINTLILPDGSYIGAVFVYTLLLTFYYILRKKSFSEPQSWKKKLAESILLGCFGLFVMEWWIIGNSPSGNPDAIHSSMFIWWIWVFLFPRIMIAQREKYLKKSILLYQIGYSLLFSVIAYTAENPLSFIFIYAYGLWIFFLFLYFYIRHEESVEILEQGKK